MKAIACCLCLLLAFSASANPVEDAVCHKSALPVARMESPEKFCRSFSRALASLPATTAKEVQALLTPENLALMGTLSAAWMGSQGVPVLGEAVDAALLALGVTLLVGQVGELAHAVWLFVNHTRLARTQAELDEAANHLARALSMVGVNVVAFILTRKAVNARGKRPSTPSEAALPDGPPVSTAAANERIATSMKAPAVLMKKVAPAVFGKWISRFQRRPVPVKAGASAGFQQKHAGPEEVLVEGGGERVWADGARADDAHLIEAKYIEKPDASPFVEGSTCPDAIRESIRSKEADQFSRYGAIIADPATPVVGLEVIVNEEQAIGYFKSLMQELRVPGRVVLKR
ncbi:hypothetical protein F0U62_07365 [Cystobacter fuscus]|uniref:restriction endonuclease fold toxin-2 domain-containing protein n=1 Tax=Cystobacter fuscus TaxID=43 RepID=UPI002B28AF24|nr:hypothetical protein F0U62_07365 [Cystobacter fuscus]